MDKDMVRRQQRLQDLPIKSDHRLTVRLLRQVVAQETCMRAKLWCAGQWQGRCRLREVADTLLNGDGGDLKRRRLAARGGVQQTGHQSVVAAC